MVSVNQPKSFCLRGVVVHADDLIEGILLNPRLPAGFDDTDNKCRPPEHAIWWGVPYIVSHRNSNPDPKFLEAFPAGIRYELRCLDGGAWDRSTWWGSFSTVQLAAAGAKGRETFRIMPVADLSG